MNKILDYNVTGQNIELASAAMLVAGTVNEYTARFAFDASWDGYQRIAVFAVDGVEREQLLTDDACDVPWEVLLPGARLKVGVYGTKDGSRLPTIWTSHRQYIHDGAGPTEEAAYPSPVLAEQILQRMGDLGQLQTEDKSSLVAAINEVRETGGGGGTSDHSKLKNRDAADQHPMSAITGLDDALAGKQPTGNYLTEEQDPTVPEWAKQPQKPAYTAQEVGALPATTHIPTALSELSEDATHRVVTDAEKATWNAKSNFTGSYNDLTDKPVIPTVPVQSVNGKTGAVVLSAEDVGALPDSTVIPAPYTLPISSSTQLGGVKPVSKTDAMTQSVGVDEAGVLWTAAGGGGEKEWVLISTVEVGVDELAAVIETPTEEEMSAYSEIFCRFTSVTKTREGADTTATASLRPVLTKGGNDFGRISGDVSNSIGSSANSRTAELYLTLKANHISGYAQNALPTIAFHSALMNSGSFQKIPQISFKNNNSYYYAAGTKLEVWAI